MTVAIILAFVIGYIVGHDVAALKNNRKLNDAMKPLIEGMLKASEQIGKPTDVHVIHHDEPYDTFPKGGHVQ